MPPRSRAQAEPADPSPGAASPPAPAAAARLVKRKARELGFDVVGIARADVPLEVEFERYRSFVDAGLHGELDYLASEPEARRRLDHDAILPGARSVVCVGRTYARPLSEERADPALAQAVARYARGHDYHNHLRKKVRRLAAYVRSLGVDVRARPLLDVEPVLERAWAARAGLGFVGKNGLVITPGRGSYQLLGEVVTTLELPPDEPLTERCGSCTRCLDACPTRAFVAPWVLDARRCISYLTIEREEPVPDEHRDAVAGHLFGCDVCQEVCPFNATARPSDARTGSFGPLAGWSTLSLAALVEADEALFEGALEGSPVRRAGVRGLRDRAVLAALSVLASRAGPPSEALRDDARRALARAALHPDPAVRDVARWARSRLVEGDVEARETAPACASRDPASEPT